MGIDEENAVQTTLLNCKYSNLIKNNLLTIYSKLRDDIVSNANIQNVIGVKETTATKYIKLLIELKIIKEIEGLGKEKYKFIK